MSIIPPGIALNLQFYLSGPLPCPYLPAQVERKLFTRLNPDDPQPNADINGALCRAGFRRSHDILYRPACGACNACVPVRIPVAVFSPSRSLRRVAAYNRDLHVDCLPPRPSAELFSLFSAYQQARHGDSDMAHMTAKDFAAMLEEGCADTHLYCLRDGDNVLQGCMIADHVGDGISAVYSFFSPEMPRRSLGTALILSLIAAAQERHWPFVYLGYWIALSRKMSYKSRFQPLQILTPNGWNWFEEKGGI
jgi:arginine-tRNA-protein transferase